MHETWSNTNFECVDLSATLHIKQNKPPCFPQDVGLNKSHNGKHIASLSVSDMPAAAPRTIFRDHFLDMAATTIDSLVKDDSHRMGSWHTQPTKEIQGISFSPYTVHLPICALPSNTFVKLTSGSRGAKNRDNLWLMPKRCWEFVLQASQTYPCSIPSR